MLRNHLTIAWRNLRKYPFYSVINVLGLALGLAAFLFIFLFVRHELSYDQYHPQAEWIYRVDADGQLGEQILTTAESGAPVGPTMQTDFPEVAAFCRFRSRGGFIVNFENRTFNEPNVIFTDSTFFQIFGAELQEGNPVEVLRAPNSAVITAAIAQKYFGLQNPVGKTLLLDNEENYTVTGVMNPIPSNTHFNYDMILSLSSLEESQQTQWGNMNFQTYVLLHQDTDVARFEAKMNDHLVSNYFAPEIEQYIGMPYQDFLDAGNAFDYSLFPVSDIHLYSDREGEMAANSDIKYVWIFSIIGAFILLIACINFMNLSTARSAVRAREIGVRKVVGATRKDLVGQFLGESFLVTALALIIAGGLIVLLLGRFNELAGKQFALADVFSPTFVGIAVGLTILTSLLAGTYPAFFLARFQTLKVLRGSITEGKSKPYLRNALVVFQFLITVFLLCGTLVVYQQLNYIQNKKIGVEREQLLLINDAYALEDNLQAFKTRMQSEADVINATVTGYLPIPSWRGSSSYFKGRTPDLDKAIITNNWRVDHDYIPTMKMELVAGRNFSTEFMTDSSATIINETMASYYEGDPIGQELSNFGGSGDDLEVFTIIGVVKDFNFESLRQTIEPLALFLGEAPGFVCLRLRTDDLPNFVNRLEANWNEMAPGQPFAYNFMDESFDRMYNAEQRIGAIIGTFAFLAIFIDCIGLIGLSTFIAQQRTKEIGIRKVLGASTAGLVQLLSRDFIKLVLVALVIAVPLAWWAMTSWLQSFAYRIDLSLGLFGLAAFLAVLIAVLTASLQSIKAALANPVDSLRGE